jgi:hypothetical protein
MTTESPAASALERAGPPPWGGLAILALGAALFAAPMAVERTASPCGALALRASALTVPATDPIAALAALAWARTAGPAKYAEMVSAGSSMPAPIMCTTYYWMSVFNPGDLTRRAG